MNPVPTSQVAESLGVSVGAIHKWSADPTFPKPEIVLKKQKLWSEDAIRTWLRKHGHPANARARHQAARRPKPSVKTHGTRGGYAQGCHCDACRDANAAYMRERRAKTSRKRKGAA